MGHSKAFELTEVGFRWLGDYEITADEVLGGITPKANKLEQVQISAELFKELVTYHLLDVKSDFTTIERELEKKVDALVKRELYTKNKTVPIKEERKIARKEYLDKCGIREVWNQTVDEGYAFGVSKELMLQVKHEHVIEQLKNTMYRHKYIPRLFNQIIGQAVNVLVKIVYKAWLDKREQAIAKAEAEAMSPPKQTELVSSIGALNELQDTLMIKRKAELSCNSKINELQEELKQKQGIFQGGARKKLEAAIHMQEQLLVENKKRSKNVTESIWL